MVTDFRNEIKYHMGMFEENFETVGNLHGNVVEYGWSDQSLQDTALLKMIQININPYLY